MIYPGDTESSGPGSYFGDSSEEFDPSRKSSNNLASNTRPADQFGSPESRKGSRAAAPGLARHPETDESYRPDRKGSGGYGGAEDDWSPYGGNRSVSTMAQFHHVCSW